MSGAGAQCIGASELPWQVRDITLPLFPIRIAVVPFSNSVVTRKKNVRKKFRSVGQP